ncbi:MAG: hypothetical protein R2713_23640 [Ilumatobacteraceae bacterium]
MSASPGWSLDTTTAPRAASASHTSEYANRIPVRPWLNTISGYEPGWAGGSASAPADANDTPGKSS